MLTMVKYYLQVEAKIIMARVRNCTSMVILEAILRENFAVMDSDHLCLVTWRMAQLVKKAPASCKPKVGFSISIQILIISCSCLVCSAVSIFLLIFYNLLLLYKLEDEFILYTTDAASVKLVCWLTMRVLHISQIL